MLLIALELCRSTIRGVTGMVVSHHFVHTLTPLPLANDAKGKSEK